MALAEIGATPAGGVNRQALSDGEIAAWRRVIAWAQEAGLTAATDAAGNLFLTLAGGDRSAPPLLVGSHLDSQPTGGKFDGAAGVMAALDGYCAWGCFSSFCFEGGSESVVPCGLSAEPRHRRWSSRRS